MNQSRAGRFDLKVFVNCIQVDKDLWVETSCPCLINSCVLFNKEFCYQCQCNYKPLQHHGSLVQWVPSLYWVGSWQRPTWLKCPASVVMSHLARSTTSLSSSSGTWPTTQWHVWSSRQKRMLWAGQPGLSASVRNMHALVGCYVPAHDQFALHIFIITVWSIFPFYISKLIHICSLD